MSVFFIKMTAFFIKDNVYTPKINHSKKKITVFCHKIQDYVL